MTDTGKTRYIDAGRRGFMQGAAVAGGTVAAGAAVAVKAAEELVEAPAMPETREGSKGYERTAHVEKYYSRARF